MELPNSQTPTETEGQTKPSTGKRSTRCTRSQVAPDWSLQELLFLVNEATAMESDFTRSLSSYQKWSIISDNCASLGIARTLNQCRQRWDLLLDQYRTIKNWEARGGVSYWTLDHQGVAEFGLPPSFDKELFIFVDDNVKVKGKEDRSGMDTDSDADFTVAMDSGSKRGPSLRPRMSKNEEQQEKCAKLNEEQQEKCAKLNEEQQEMCAKLREQTDLINAILKGNTEGNICNDFNGPRPGETEVEFKRRQADELIKVLGSLAGNIDKLSDLVQGSG